MLTLASKHIHACTHTCIHTYVHILTHFYESKCQYPAVKDECSRLTPVWQVRSILTVSEPIGSLSQTPTIPPAPSSLLYWPQAHSHFQRQNNVRGPNSTCFSFEQTPKGVLLGSWEERKMIIPVPCPIIPLHVYSVAPQPRSLPLCSNVIALLITS